MRINKLADFLGSPDQKTADFLPRLFAGFFAIFIDFVRVLARLHRFKLHLNANVSWKNLKGHSPRKLGSNVLLKQTTLNCYRCVRLALRSTNVLQVKKICSSVYSITGLVLYVYVYRINVMQRGHIVKRVKSVWNVSFFVPSCGIFFIAVWYP